MQSQSWQCSAVKSRGGGTMGDAGLQAAVVDGLRAHLQRVRVADGSTRVFKEECCITFDTPRSKAGLLVDLNSFLAFSERAAAWQHAKTGNTVFLRIQEVEKEKEGKEEEEGEEMDKEPPSKKPTLLAIGVEGGFNPEKEVQYETRYSVVLLPDKLELPYPNNDLPEIIRMSVESVIAAEGAERKQQVSAWVADKKRVAKSALSLVQLHNGVTVPSLPALWQCSKCDKRENLWMNLSDGTILCGRRNWDGTGGNGHALMHYEETKFPLAVKLGTITPDLETADVYSYEEDDTVEDPMLAKHLAHFGIDFSSLSKTEQTTAERELDQNMSFDWNRMQEQGKTLQPLFGAGFTGLANLGNRCAYLGNRCANLGNRCANLGNRCAYLGNRCANLGNRCAYLGNRCAYLGSRCATLGNKGAACLPLCDLRDWVD
ncbi:unnamed protein product [Closterium sp. NIES-54]